MCEKKYFGKRSASRRIDPCLVDEIEELNKNGTKTVASCCGHGKYPRSIIVIDADNKLRNGKNMCFDYDTHTRVNDYKPKLKKQNQKWYKRDDEGYYYIPQLMEIQWS